MNKLKGMLKTAFNKHTAAHALFAGIYSLITYSAGSNALTQLSYGSIPVVSGALTLAFGAVTAGAVNKWKAAATGKYLWEPKISPMLGL